MKILDNAKSLSVLASSITNGLGQIQPLSAIVTEELNGIYELEFTCLTTDKHYADLKQNGLVKVTVGDGSEQIFRVYSITEPINFVVTVRCQHISYDLSRVIVKPFQAVGAVLTCNSMIGHTLGNYPFTMTTDISNTTSTFKLDIPRSFRECLGGYEGSILDVFRGEYEWDNLEVKMLARRGHDNGVRISYGKNLTDYEQETNNESVYDGVYGYAVVDEVTYQASSIYNKTGATTPKVLAVDFSNKYESGDVPTEAELLNYATQYATNNDIEIPKVNIKVDFIPLWQTEEYKNVLPLERVSLGDTVHVYFDELGVEASSRVIKTEWNVLTQKYDSIELGDSRANMNTVITDTVQETVGNMDIKVEADVGWLDDKLENITTLIANGLGLHITQDSAGRIILHNEETIAQSQYQYMITASGFQLSEDYGQNWSSGWTTSGDAVLNSLSTITLRALEIYGSYIQGSQIVFGDPTDPNGKYIRVQPYPTTSDTKQGVSFDGTGTIRMQPQDRFYLNNLASDGTNMYNQIVMDKQGSTFQSNYIELINNDDTQNYLRANFFEMDAHFSSDNEFYNRTVIHNYSTASGTHYEGNYWALFSYADRNFAYMLNYKPQVSTASGITKLVANYIQFSATSSIDGMYLYNYRLDANYQANKITLLSNSTRNYSVFGNNRIDGNYLANYIEESSNSTENNFYLVNIKRSSTVETATANDYGNRIYLSATDSRNTFWAENYRPGSTNLKANYIQMVGTPTNGGGTNGVYVYNYDPDGQNIANSFYMTKSSSVNSIAINLNRGGTRVGFISMIRSSDGTVTIDLGTLTNETYGYKGAQAHFTSDGVVSFSGSLLKFNGETKWQ